MFPQFLKVLFGIEVEWFLSCYAFTTTKPRSLPLTNKRVHNCDIFLCMAKESTI